MGSEFCCCCLIVGPVVAPSDVGGGGGLSRELTITWTVGLDFPLDTRVRGVICKSSQEGDVLLSHLEGIVQSFKVRLYEVVSHSQCVTYNRCQSARP